MPHRKRPGRRLGDGGWVDCDGTLAAVRRTLTLVATAVLTLGACASGPNAPDVGALETECGDNFCVSVPTDWEIVERTGEFLSLRHPLAPEEAVGTVGQVNMEGILNAAGEEWPQTANRVVESFWALIDDGGAELATMAPLQDGSVESFGTFEGGRLWYRLAPTEGRMAVGVEVRGPNSSWAEHAEAILDSLVVLP